jgi:hypothetical protein
MVTFPTPVFKNARPFERLRIPVDGPFLALHYQLSGAEFLKGFAVQSTHLPSHSKKY